MLKKEKMTPRERAMEEAKKKDEELITKKALSKAEIFKGSIPGAVEEDDE